MPVAFYRVSTYDVRVYGMRPQDIERFCMALQEYEPKLHSRGPYRDPSGLLYYAVVDFREDGALRDQLPPVGSIYGHEDVVLLMNRAGVRMIHQLGEHSLSTKALLDQVEPC